MTRTRYTLGCLAIGTIPIAACVVLAFAPAYMLTFLAGLFLGRATYVVWRWWRARYLRSLRASVKPLSFAETRIMLDGVVRRDVQ